MRACAGILLAMVLLAASGLGRADPAVGRSTQAEQALYNDAQAAFDKGDWDDAISGFNAALASAPREGRSEAVIRVRLAEALLDKGRTIDAETQARKAIDLLAAGSPTHDADLAYAELILGDALQADLSFDAAIDAFKQAKALATGPSADDQSVAAALGIVQSAMVTHPDLAAATADAILADDAHFRAQPREWQSQVLTLRARAELNRGNLAAAKSYVDKALTLVGPLGTKVDLFQVEVRGDAALIYALLHDDERMRELLTYTGAGHLPDDLWGGATNVRPLPCTSEISPKDTAVVEFAIGDDGQTVGAAPIYASRPGQMGVEFAKAVRQWRWRPEVAAKLDSFWRASMRVQLSCSRHASQLTRTTPSLPDTDGQLEPAITDPDGDRLEGQNGGKAPVSCDTFPGRPGLIRGVPGNSDFPNEAKRWGFEGIVEESVDIGTHGEVISVRPLIAYPPFVFVDAAQRMVRYFAYRPASPSAVQFGCNQMAIRVNYKLPGH